MEGKVAETLRSKEWTITSAGGGSIPYRMQTGWLGDYIQSSNTEHATIVNAYAAGLEHFSALVHRSSDPGLDHLQALSQIRRSGANTARVQHSDRTSEVGVASRGGGVTWEVLDASSCKLASWRAAFTQTSPDISISHGNRNTT